MELLVFIFEVLVGCLICYRFYIFREGCKETVTKDSDIWIKNLTEED